MYTRSALKELSKQQLRGRWTEPVLVTLIYGMISSVASIFWIVLVGPFELGLSIFYLNLIDTTGNRKIEDMFKGFNNFEKSLGMFWWIELWKFLWTLLFIVPGIIKALAYSQSYFILAENPNIKVRDAVKLSMRITQGHKGEIFVMGLSFIGWALLTFFTFGIGMLWLYPYMYTSYANLYRKLRDTSIQNGVCRPEEFGIIY